MLFIIQPLLLEFFKYNIIFHEKLYLKSRDLCREVSVALDSVSASSQSSAGRAAQIQFRINVKLPGSGEADQGHIVILSLLPVVQLTPIKALQQRQAAFLSRSMLCELSWRQCLFSSLRCLEMVGFHMDYHQSSC